jgi:hypothetical protein
MKKTDKDTKSSKPKTPRQKRERKSNPLFDIIKNMDESHLSMLRQIVQSEFKVDSENSLPHDPVGLFTEYLRQCSQGNFDDGENTEILEELAFELTELKISSNGGDREAREQIQAVYDLLDDALERHAMHPADMMMISKIFADAGWAVPDSLRQALAEALQTALPDNQSGAGSDIVLSLLELADQNNQNPFEMHEFVTSLLAGLPPEAGVALVYEMIAGKKTVIDQAVAGFVLHPEAVLAQAAVEGLAASAKQTPVESLLVERLVRMRPWLPQPRQVQLDAAVRVMRSNALPPTSPATPKVIKCYASVCDGSGTRNVLVTQRAGTRYQIATVMMKLAGVADAMVIPELSKSEMDDIVRQMKSSVPMSEANLDGVTRILELAISDNFASGVLPPFKLVEVAERLGLGPLHPNHASPMEIITTLLAALPPEQTNQSAVAIANADVLDSEFKYQWFEAGEALEDLLYAVKGSKQRIAKLMKVYLPERRLFWARQCAISALVMHGDEKARHLPWKHLALVGRDIASPDVPLDQIPLMKQVAEISVRVFERRM